MEPLVGFGPLICFGLFLGMLAMLELGRRLGVRRLALDPEGARASTGAVDGAVFALLGLLIAFTFSGAASRFDERRELVVQEANDVGTAWLRIGLLPETAQPAVRELFRRYLDSRIATYRKLPDFEAARAEYQQSMQLQNEIWRQSLAASRLPGTHPSAMQVVPALNAMFDTAATRIAAFRMHPPVIVFVMLFALALAGALLAGTGMAAGRARHWLHIVGFAAVMALTAGLDVELPGTQCFGDPLLNATGPEPDAPMSVT
jgi:hypothetical protein